jgi:hypothetical protein
MFSHYFTVFLASSLKFAFGPVMGLSFGLNWWEIALFTALGMMFSVTVVSFGGERVHNWYVKKYPQKLFTKRKRLIVRVWRKYGLFGVAALTPIVFTPIGGAIIAVSLGERPTKILPYMLASAIFWALVQAIFFSYFYHIIAEYVHW